MRAVSCRHSRTAGSASTSAPSTPWGQLLAPQHAPVVHLRGYPDVQCALFELLSGHRDKCRQHRRPHRIEQQSSAGKPGQRHFADLPVDRIREQVADQIAGADLGDVGPVHVVAVELDGLPAEGDATEVIE